MENYNINKEGFYGDFGGAFIPEMLHPNIEELQKNILRLQNHMISKKSLISSYLIMLVDRLHFILLKDFQKNTIQKFI
jgi:tryptophan synthase beta subunit